MKVTGLDQIKEKPSRLLWWKHKNTEMSTGKGWLQVLLMKIQRWTTPTEWIYKVNFDENPFGNSGKLSAGVGDSWGKVLAAMPSLGHMGREAIEVEALAAWQAISLAKRDSSLLVNKITPKEEASPIIGDLVEDILK